MTDTLVGARVNLLANAVHARMITNSEACKLFAANLLGCKTKGTALGSSGWMTFFNYEKCEFPAGFMYTLGKALTAMGAIVAYRVQSPPAPLGPEIGTFDPKGFGFTEKYDYQPNAVRELLKYGRMIAQVATGGGKSNIAILTYSTIRRNTLFLTTRSSLMYQMKEQFDECGMPAGVIGDSVWEPRKGINVGMVQTFASMLRAGGRSAEKARLFLSKMEVLIGEEAHEAAGNGYFEVANECRNAHYRLALTATPFMKEDEEANMRLQAVFGSIGIVISEKMLIDRGILAEPFFKYATSEAPPMLKRRDGWPAAQELGIVENKSRNLVAVKEAALMKSIGFPVISLVQREKHGLILKDMMDQAGIRTAFLSGKASQDERQRGLRDLASGNLDTLIGSTIFDVGVDVPSVGMVQLMGGGKDEVAMRQRIGRSLRAKKSGKNIAFVLDHEDTFNRIMRDHAIIRKTLVQSTPGFGERIIQKDKDWPL